jgi:hypothetical protein
MDANAIAQKGQVQALKNIGFRSTLCIGINVGAASAADIE